MAELTYFSILLNLLGATILLILWNRRYIRVKAIIVIATAGFLGPTFVSFTSKLFNVQINTASMDLGAILLGTAGILSLTLLECWATKQHIFGATLDAIIAYQKLLKEDAEAEERLVFLKSLRGRPDIDRSIADIILAAELGDQT